jgi:hypothetical protein
MKRLLLALLWVSAPLAAQQPPVGYIDTYGARTLTADQLRAAAGISIGDSVTARLETAARAGLLALPNVRAAHVAAVCCENGRSIVYLGVIERSAPAFTFAAAPAGEIRLPGNIVQVADAFERALQDAVLQGQAEESDSLGHSLMQYPPARELQQHFANYAAGNVARLRDVLQNSADARHRAIAAHVIAYAFNKVAIVADLIGALRDPDEAVRNNAMRALGVMAAYNQKHAESMLRIPYEPFLTMLSSPVWTDRNKAALVLMSLTGSREPMMLHQLRSRAFAELVEMAQWQASGHALPAALILGRMAGLPDDEILPAFQKDRAALIEAARGTP